MTGPALERLQPSAILPVLPQMTDGPIARIRPMALNFSTDLQSIVPFALQRPEQVDGITRAEFDDVVRASGVPTVITGGMDDWSSIDTWTSPDRLADLLGEDSTVFCRKVVQDAVTYTEDFIPYRFGDFLHEVYSIGESDHYLTQALVFEPEGILRKAIRDSFPGLLQVLAQDCALPPFIEPHEFAEGIMWMGSGEQVTPLHYDPAENLNCTIMGRKRWILFPPDEAENLMVDGNTGKDGMLSNMDDLIAGGEWRGGPVKVAYDVETAPGQILYMPAGWSHHVLSCREPSAAINFWFIDHTWPTFKQYAHWQSRDRYGYADEVRRKPYSAALFAGVMAMRAANRVAPRLIPTPELKIGEASYERQGAT